VNAARPNRPAPDGLVVSLDREQSGLVLSALAELPFKTVYALIGKLNQQAHENFPTARDRRTPKPFRMEPGEFALCLQALGALPYQAVSRLMEHLRTQLSERMD
jgi:hypothetical protein